MPGLPHLELKRKTHMNLSVEQEDRLRHNRWVRKALYEYGILKERTVDPQNVQAVARSIDRLCQLARLAPSAQGMLRVESKIHERKELLNGRGFDWTEFAPNIVQRRINKGVVLKPWISPQEKGVVFISFEEQWVRLLGLADLQAFAERYTLVVSPAWSPPHNLVNCVFPELFPGPVFCLISNMKDLQIFPRLSKQYVMVPLFACSWVNPAWCRPLPYEQKDIDILMLANFGKFKRHFALFQALSQMPASLRVLLVGQNDGGRTAETLLAEADRYGVRGRFQLRSNVSHQEVFEVFRRAKISLVLSRREGSCVAVVESLFSGTPVGIYEDAEIGSRVYINDATGRFFQHENLAGQLMDFLVAAHSYHPQEWVMKEGISCFESTARLNQILKQHALANGQKWTQDIAVHHWHPNPQLASEEDQQRLRPEYEYIKSRFGIVIGPG